VREITRSALICPRWLISSSVMPSAKYSCAASPDRFSNGSTARERILGAESVRELKNQADPAASTRTAAGISIRGLRMNALAGRPVSSAALSPDQDAEPPGGVPHRGAAANRMSARDANARFAAVVLPHLDDAYALARWLTRNRADAEDVVQDACLRAFRGIAGFADGNARAWVLTIVRHAAYVWLRKNHPAALIVVEDLEAVEHRQANSTARDADTPETALIAKGEAKRLEAAIAALPAPFRETLVLRDLQGLAYREIAEVTRVPIGTVMSRLARARQRLSETAGPAAA
jgi:RNA polymerase sigma factor (sigma-70 family)